MRSATVVRRGAVRVLLAAAQLEPPHDLRGRVDELWEQERRVRPTLVDGTMVSVDAIDADRILARPCAYRLFVARERDKELRDRLGVRALGVSGLLLVDDDGGEPSVLLGRRSPDVTEYGGAWELVPSGGIDPLRASPDGIVDAEAALMAELEEEVGVHRDAIARSVPLGLVHDADQDGYDVCFALRLPAMTTVQPAEYEVTMLLSATDAGAWLGSAERAVVPTSPALLELAHDAGLL